MALRLSLAGGNNMMPFTLTLAINNMNISIRGHKLNIADKLVLRGPTFTSRIPRTPVLKQSVECQRLLLVY